MADVTKLIEADHREAEALFSQFRENPSKDTAMMICTEIEVHAAAEESVFYPAVRDDVPGGEKLAGEGEDEHGEARQLIGRIKNTSDEGHLAELVNELEQAINHHVSEEESEMLPKTREALDAVQLEDLASRFEAAKS